MNGSQSRWDGVFSMSKFFNAQEYLRSFFHFGRYLWHQKDVKRNEAYKSLFKDRRCFIVCTGSSVKNIDLKILARESVFGCNVLFKHPDARYIKFAAYFSLESVGCLAKLSDPYFNSGQYYRELSEFSKTQNCPVFQTLGMKEYCLENYGVTFNNSRPLISAGRLSIATDIYNNLAGRFNMMDGVAYAMIGAAVFMGFREIYLIGCDYTFSPVQIGHFYDDFSQVKIEDVDPRHFLVHKFLKQKNTRIWNLTPEGFASPIYPSITIEDLTLKLNDASKLNLGAKN